MWQLDPDTMRWTEIKPRGKGPEPRRRQALCQVVRMLKNLLIDKGLFDDIFL